MFRLGYTVTLPTSPGGIRTLRVRAARSPQAAVRRATTGWRRRWATRTTAPSYHIEWTATPEVWRLGRQPHRVAGPTYGD